MLENGETFSNSLLRKLLEGGKVSLTIIGNGFIIKLTIMVVPINMGKKDKQIEKNKKLGRYYSGFLITMGYFSSKECIIKEEKRWQQ